MNDLSATRFNIKDSKGQYLCPVCGFAEFFKEPIYSNEEGGVIGAGICPSCFWEPGFDDNPHASANAHNTIIESIRSYRKNWNKKWRGSAIQKPTSWNVERQLSRLFELAPYVR